MIWLHTYIYAENDRIEKLNDETMKEWKKAGRDTRVADSQ